MKFCINHWNELRDVIKSKGMWDLVASNGYAVAYRMKQELEGTETNSTFDPLMSAYNMISTKALEQGGLYLLSGDYCPLCELEKNVPSDIRIEWKEKENIDSWATVWIQDCTNSILEYVKENKLI